MEPKAAHSQAHTPEGFKMATSSARKSFTWKNAEKTWHPEVRELYNSLKSSEHFDEFQKTDMAHARIVAILLSDALYNSVEVNAAHLKNLFEQWDKLGATLGTRRKLQLEVEKVVEEQKAGELMNAMALSIITGKPLQ